MIEAEQRVETKKKWAFRDLKPHVNQVITNKPIKVCLPDVGECVIEETYVEPFNITVSENFIAELSSCYRKGCTKRKSKARQKQPKRLQTLTFDEVKNYVNDRLKDIFTDDDIIDQPWNVYTLWGIDVGNGCSFEVFVKKYMRKYFEITYRTTSNKCIITDNLTGNRFEMTYSEFKKSGVKMSFYYTKSN